MYDPYIMAEANVHFEIVTETSSVQYLSYTASLISRVLQSHRLNSRGRDLNLSFRLMMKENLAANNITNVKRSSNFMAPIT